MEELLPWGDLNLWFKHVSFNEKLEFQMSTIYRKTPSIGPWAYVRSNGPSGGLIRGWAYTQGGLICEAQIVLSFENRPSQNMG